MIVYLADQYAAWPSGPTQAVADWTVNRKPLFVSGKAGGTGAGTAAHVKSGWRDPAYDWIEVTAYGDLEPTWVRGRRRT